MPVVSTSSCCTTQYPPPEYRICVPGSAVTRTGGVLAGGTPSRTCTTVGGGGWRTHFNLPGVGVEPGELLREAVRREVREETCAAVEVGPLLAVREYAPAPHAGRYGARPYFGLVFRCELRLGSEPRRPDAPDPHQTAVRWVPLEELPDNVLGPGGVRHLRAVLAAPPPVDPFILWPPVGPPPGDADATPRRDSEERPRPAGRASTTASTTASTPARRQRRDRSG